MNISKRIKDILYQQNLTLTQLNDLLNERKGTNHSVQNLSRKLISDSLKYSDVEDILDVLGYSLEIVSNKHLDEVAVTKINYDEKHEEEEEISDLFQGSSKLSKMIDKEFEKYMEAIIYIKAREYFEKLLSDKAVTEDLLSKLRNKLAHNECLDDKETSLLNGYNKK